MSLPTSDGLLSDYTETSNYCIMGEPGEETKVTNQRAERENWHADNPDLEATDSEESTHTKEGKVKQDNHRTRKRDNPSTFSEPTEITEKAPGKADLPKVTAVQIQGQHKRRMANSGKTLKRLRSKAEKEYVPALIRFHNRNIEGLRTAIRQEKRVQANKKQKSNLTKTTAFVHLAPKETVNENTVTRVSKKIEEIKAEIMSLSTILDVNNKQKRDYTGLISDSPNIKRGQEKINPSQTQNKKRKEHRKND